MYRDEFKNLPLSDRFMFGEVMRNPGTVSYTHLTLPTKLEV